MITKLLFTVFAALWLNALAATAAEQFLRLSLNPSATGLSFTWPATVQKEDGSIEWPYFELQRSTDLKNWQPIGERQRAQAATPGQSLGTTLGADGPLAFYRLLSIQPSGTNGLGSGGAEVFGYGDAFASALQSIGQISPDQFAVMFPSPTNYLPGISFDPATALYWNQFNANPDVQLSAPEFALFKTNGFVVSERLGGDSFADVFYRLWHNDLPVFISTDALLQAWHRTYDAMLEEIEETYLVSSFQTMLEEMAAQIPAASAQVGSGALKDSLLDADYFLAVARSLLAGTNSQPVPTQLGQDPRVDTTWRKSAARAESDQQPLT